MIITSCCLLHSNYHRSIHRYTQHSHTGLISPLFCSETVNLIETLSESELTADLSIETQTESELTADLSAPPVLNGE